MYNVDAIVKSALSTPKVANKLMKYWATFAKSHEIPMDLKENYWLTDSAIFDNNDDILSLVPYLFLNNCVGTTGSFTLSDLIDTDKNEDYYGLRQFNVIPSRVGSLVFSILDERKLYEPIELGYVDDPETPIIVSGRHRLFALVSIFSKVEGWENLSVPVSMQQYATVQELTKVIEMKNGSRAMSSEEKLVLWYGSQGLDSLNEEDLFQPCKESLAAFNKACTLYFTNELEENTEINLQPSTLGKIGNSFAGKFRSALPTNIRKFLKNQNIAHEVASCAVDTLVDNWSDLHGLCREIKLDNEGKEVVTYNVARNGYNKIGQYLADGLATIFIEQLKDKAKDDAQQKELKRQAAELKAKERQQQELEKARALLQSMGATVELPKEALAV